MNYKLKFIKLFLILLCVNLSGAALRYFNLDTYFIFLGFRFHLSFILPFILVLKKERVNCIKDFFKNPFYTKNISFIIWMILPLLIIFPVFYLFFNLELKDPNYLYEFGFSSIIDYPIYLIWNSPQLLMIFIFLEISSKNRTKILSIIIIIIFLFLFEFIPSEKNGIELINFDYLSFIPLVLAAVITAILLSFYQNIYWYVIFVFTIFWINILAFGSDSETLINLLFASQYNSWEGFFSVDKIISEFILIIQITLIFILILILLLFNRNSKQTIL